MANSRIDFEVGFITNSKGLKELKSELAEIRAMASSIDYGATMDPSKLQAMVKSANDLEYAMNAAFDVDLNTVNVQKFNQILKQSGTDLKQIQQGLANAGTTGQSAFLKATAGLMQFNTAAKQTNKFLDSIATSFANTIKWSAMSSIINTITGTIQKSYYYVKDLDTALNDIRIVTGKNADEMSRFAESANDAAKALAVTTEDYTQGSLIYYQQGLDDETVKALTDITAKTSNVTGQSMSAVSEELTAVWNGYKVANEAATEGMQVYEEYVDKMAAVGASTASDLQELSTAMSKVASAASAMGVDFDDLNAQIATIVSVTRQAPESVGTALKTIYARLGDLKVDGVDEFGTKLGEVTSQLQTMGIQILDQNGDMRAMTDVMAEVAEKWDTWTSAQRQAAAVAMAGKRQYNNLVALFDNWDMYGDALKVSMEAAGTLEEQQEIALDSLANKMDTLKATAEDLYDSLYDEEDIKGLIEGLTKVVQGFADFSDAIGGLNNLIPMLGATAARVFSNQIANGLSTVIINAQNARHETEMMEQNYAELQSMFSNSSLFTQTVGMDQNQLNVMEQGVNELKQYYSDMQKYQNIMNQEQKETYNNILNNIAKVGELNLKIAETSKFLNNPVDSWELIDQEVLKNTKDVSKLIIETNKINEVVIALEKELNSEGFSIDREHSIFNSLSDTQVANIFQRFGDEAIETKEDLQKLIDKLKEVGNHADEIAKLTQQTNNLNSGIKEVGSSLESNLNLQKSISNITNTIGALGQLAMSINTIKNLGSIWGDKDIETGEKILQTVMNLSFVLPSLVTAINAINNAMGIQLGIGKLIATDNALRLALSSSELKVTGLLTKAKIEDAIINQFLEKTIVKLNGERVTSVAVLGEEQRQLVLDQALKGADAEVTKLLATRQGALNTVLAASPWFLVAAGIIAVTAAAFVYEKYQEKQLKNIEEENKQLIELENKKQETIENNEKEYSSFMQVYNAYKEGKATKDELKTATENLNEEYQKEIDKLGLMADEYDRVAESIKKKRKAEIEEGKKSAEKEKNAAEERLVAAGQLNAEGLFRTNGNIQTTSINSGINIVDDMDVARSFKKSGVNLLNTGSAYLGDITYDITKPEEIVKVYDQYNKAIKDAQDNLNPADYINSELYNQTLNWVNEMTEAVEDYKAAMSDLAEYEAELAAIDFDASNIKDLNSYEEEVNKLAEEIKKVTGLGDSEEDEQKALKLAQDKLLIENASLKIYQQQLETVKQLQENGRWSNFSADQLKNLFNNYNSSELLGIDNYVIDNVGFELTPTNLPEVIEKVREEMAKTAIPITLEASSSLIEGLQNGKINALNIGENEEYQKLIDTLDILQKAYPELTAQAEILNKTWLVGTQEYIEALEKLQDKAYELDLQQSIDEVNKLIENTNIDIMIDADPSAFSEKMEEILDKEYEIDVKIHTEAEREFTSVEKAFEDIHNKASLIGDDFVVASDKIRELNQTFPGILEGIKFVGDGTVQLNKDIVESAMAAAEAEAKADAEATISKLKSQAKLLRAKQTIYEKMANLAFTLAKTETDNSQASTELQKEFSNALTELKEVNSKKSADKELTHQKQVADSSNINANQLLTNWKSAFEGVATSSLAAAEAAIQNMNAISSKGATPTTKGDFSKVNYNGANGTSTTAEDADSIETILKNTGESDAQKAWAKIGEQYAMLADEAGAAANDVEGMIIQIGAGGQKVDKAFKGVASGLGSDGKKDKSKGSKKEYKEDEPDRYWEINKALNEIERTLKKVEKIKSHVFGKQKIQAINAEIKLIKQQTQQYEKLYEEQKKEAEELRGKLSAGGMAFDAEGQITNYGNALKSALATYNAAVDQFNAGLMNETAFKVAEKNYENFKKNVDRYDKLFYTEMKDTKEKIEDAVQKLRDEELEKFKIKLEVKIDKAKLRKEFRNFRKEMEKDFTLHFKVLPDTKDFKKNFKDDKAQVNAYKKQMKDVEKEIDTIMSGGSSKMFASLSEAQEYLKDLNEKFEEASKEAMQDVIDAWDNYLELIDQTNEKLEQQQDRYKAIKDELDDWKEMIELIYGDKAYDKMNDYYKQAEYNSLSQIDALKKTSDAWETQFQAALKAQGASMDRMDEWSEDLTKLYENWQQSESDLRKATIDHINLIKDDYNNAVSGVLDSLEKQLTNGMGMEDMEKEWEQATKWADKYYDEVEKVYHIQTLNNKIQKSINEQSNVKNAQKLERLREKELSALREKKYMTEYDLKAAEARYDITLKEIALEDARNNKSTMKLSRNSEGNWSYQYVADEEDVSDKQQDLLDAIMKLQDLSTDQVDKLTEERNEAYKTYLAEVKYLTDKAQKENWTQEELDKKLEALEKQYFDPVSGIITLINQEFNQAKNDAAESGLAVQAECYRQDKENFANIEAEKKELFDNAIAALIQGYVDGFQTEYNKVNSEMRTSWEEHLTGEGGIYKTWQTTASNLEQDVKDVAKRANDEINNKFTEYKNNLAEVQKTSGIEFNKISGYIKDTATATNDVNKNIQTLIGKTSKITDQRKAVEKLQKAWDGVSKSIADASKKAEDYLKKNQKISTPSTTTNGGSSSSSSSTTTPAPSTNTSSSGTGKKAGGTTTSNANQSSIKSTNQTIATYYVEPTTLAGGVNGWKLYRTSGQVTPTAMGTSTNLRTLYPGKHVYKTDYGKHKFGEVAFKTGGYTGTWSGNEGRLAELHQKELVLNAKDTENFLEATNSLRNLVALDNSIEQSIAEAMSKMILQMSAKYGSNMSSAQNANNTNNTFNITAEFPNANDVTEIREAILSLPNIASQYVSRQRI